MVDPLLLYPPFREAIEAMEADLAADGYTFKRTSGFRSATAQNSLYAKGRTAPGPRVTQAKGGQSLHNYGLGMDYCCITDGKEDWTESKYNVLGKYARKHGLVWGGDWNSFKDRPHVEYDLKSIGLSIKDLMPILLKDGLPAVWKLLEAARKG